MDFFDSPILDIIISLVLIYALLSFLVSILNEFLSQLLEERSGMLRSSIMKLLSDESNANYGELFFNHRNIQAITRLSARRIFGFFKRKSTNPKETPPSYISASLFADTLIDIIAAQASRQLDTAPQKDASGNPVLDASGNKTPAGPGTALPGNIVDRFVTGVEAMKPSPFRDLMLGFYERAGKDYTKMKTLMETWFNEYQDRVSGWYKAQQRRKTFWLGLAVAILLNVDSLHLVRMISLDDDLRASLVNTAVKVSDEYQDLSDDKKENINSMVWNFAAADSIAADAIYKNVNGDTAHMENHISSLLDMVKKNAPGKYNIISYAMRTDSLQSVQYRQQSDQVLAIVSDLNIPIGYSLNTAPVSWFCRDKKIQTPDMNNSLLLYNEQRNEGGGWVYFKYLLGLLVSAFSLGAGAPFWFNVLVKLVDIRRAGIKPKAEKTEQ